jgi:AraC-like DNA-binding protein
MAGGERGNRVKQTSASIPDQSPGSGLTQIRRLSTAGLPARDRIEYWNEIACNTFTAQSVDPLVDLFDAEISRAELGDTRAAVAVSKPSTITRNSHQVARSRHAYFLLHLHLSGESINRQDGHEIKLAQGDFAMVDSTRPYQISFDQDTAILVLRFPQSQVRRVIAHPEAITLLPMSGKSGAGRVASRFIQDVWHGLEEGMSTESAGRLCRPLLDVIANAYAEVPAAHVEASSMSGALRVQIRSFIEEHLGEQDLGPATIATAFGISTRYVHSLFATDRHSVSEYIQQRRLEAAARVLTDPLHPPKSIAAVAFAHGFKSHAHFSRMFHEHYGTTPREFRR